jgi:hypothetical protein
MPNGWATKKQTMPPNRAFEVNAQVGAFHFQYAVQNHRCGLKQTRTGKNNGHLIFTADTRNTFAQISTPRRPENL